jgi:hypothetical protein
VPTRARMGEGRGASPDSLPSSFTFPSAMFVRSLPARPGFIELSSGRVENAPAMKGLEFVFSLESPGRVTLFAAE